jgi:23S rRNA (cytosine1962-C5)-methyltransferase
MNETADALLLPFANRLRKNAQHWGRWARRAGIECYRLYDRDIPEYPLIVDRYGTRLHVQELAPVYAAATIKPQVWAKALCSACALATQLAPEAVVVKARHGQRPDAQYRRNSQRGEDLVVHEDGLQFIVNLERYLDTGLFIDHRDTRHYVRGLATGKRILNLFCYTASFSVYAAAGGATSSLSVDMSRTYLDWARRNLRLNGFDIHAHEVMQADVLQFVREPDFDRVFDLIVLDPPSFSNSKRMQGVFDVQRDHAALIEACDKLLASAGTLLFSTNLQTFRLDATLSARWAMRELNKVPPDFRNRRVHRSWQLSKAPTA